MGCEFAAPQMCYCFCVFPSWSLFLQRKMSNSAKYTISWQWVSHTGSQQPARQIPLLSLERPSSTAPWEAGLSLHRELPEVEVAETPTLGQPHLGSCWWRGARLICCPPHGSLGLSGAGLPRASSPQLLGTSCHCMKPKVAGHYSGQSGNSTIWRFSVFELVKDYHVEVNMPYSLLLQRELFNLEVGLKSI